MEKLVMYRVKKASYYILFMPLFCLLCCKNTKIDGFHFDRERNVYKDSGLVKRVPISISKDVESISSIGMIDTLIVLDTAVAIGIIDKISIVEKSVYIMDKGKAKGFFCFGLDGKLKWKYVNQGRGNGKYVRLGDFQIHNGQVYLYDNLGKKLIVLDRNGQFIKELVYPEYTFFYPDYFFIDRNDNVIVYNEDFGDYEKFPYSMTTFDSSCKNILSCNFPQTDNLPIGRWETAVSPMQNFVGDKGFYLTKPMNDTIFSYSDGLFSRKYFIDFGKFRVPDKIRSQKDFTLQKFWTSSYMSNIERVVDGDSLLSFSFGDGSRPAMAVIDKQTLQSKSYIMVLFNIDGYYQTVLPVGGSDGLMVNTVDPLNIIRFYESARKKDSALSESVFEEKFQKEMPGISMLHKKISITSNPILVVTKLSRAKLFDNEK